MNWNQLNQVEYKWGLSSLYCDCDHDGNFDLYHPTYFYTFGAYVKHAFYPFDCMFESNY